MAAVGREDGPTSSVAVESVLQQYQSDVSTLLDQLSVSTLLDQLNVSTLLDQLSGATQRRTRVLLQTLDDTKRLQQRLITGSLKLIQTT